MNKTLFSDRYLFTLSLVSELFRDISRKDPESHPALNHLVGVAYILVQVTDDEDVVIAGLLHDVLEDVDSSVYSEADMRRDFGDKVTEMVKCVSHFADTHGREKSREIYLEQIQNGSIGACLVSAADMLNNSVDVINLYERNPDWTKQQFGGEGAKLRDWFWKERLGILTSRLGADNPLIKELGPVLKRIQEIHVAIS